MKKLTKKKKKTNKKKKKKTKQTNLAQTVRQKSKAYAIHPVEIETESVIFSEYSQSQYQHYMCERTNQSV